MKDSLPEPDISKDSEIESSSQEATPLRCFISAIISSVFAFGLYKLFNSIVQTYAVKTITSHNPIAINLSSAVRTLVMGVVAMATGIFAMVAIGLVLLGIQLTIQSVRKA